MNPRHTEFNSVQQINASTVPLSGDECAALRELAEVEAGFMARELVAEKERCVKESAADQRVAIGDMNRAQTVLEELRSRLHEREGSVLMALIFGVSFLLTTSAEYVVSLKTIPFLADVQNDEQAMQVALALAATIAPMAIHAFLDKLHGWPGRIGVVLDWLPSAVGTGLALWALPLIADARPIAMAVLASEDLELTPASAAIVEKALKSLTILLAWLAAMFFGEARDNVRTCSLRRRKERAEDALRKSEGEVSRRGAALEVAQAERDAARDTANLAAVRARRFVEMLIAKRQNTPGSPRDELTRLIHESRSGTVVSDRGARPSVAPEETRFREERSHVESQRNGFARGDTDHTGL